MLTMWVTCVKNMLMLIPTQRHISFTHNERLIEPKKDNVGKTGQADYLGV